MFRSLLIVLLLCLSTNVQALQQTPAEPDSSVLSILTAWLSLNNDGPEQPDAKPDVMLRVVRVTEDWMPYASTDGWTAAALIKESDSLKYYEVAIWEEVDAVHLYAFDEDFDPYYGLQPGISDEEKIEYREQYRIMRFENLPEPVSAERSEFLVEVFKEFTGHIVEKHPDVNHHLMYSGHGGPDGRLFDRQVYPQDAARLLANWTGQLGKRLGVIDMGGPCNKSAVSDNSNFCQYSQFYVASDLPNGGYQFDDWTLEKYLETQPEHQYHRLLRDNEELVDTLKGRIDLKRQDYQYARNYMIENEVMQANYLFDCDSYLTFQEALDAFAQTNPINQTRDLRYNLEQQNATELLELFDAMIVHSADNKDFFEWPEEHNGVQIIE
ncbi:hypothetical protein [Idiomarina sp.]|uniref:hypothetical protein n=1 Tax=Idiomarina sp. TaxID=1874361 RepID=UPI00260172F1|nr:hypothetical protein [Idiomarina sp.]